MIGTIFVFVATYLLSLLASFTVAVGLAVVFNADQEFIAVQFALMAASLFVIGVFFVVYFAAKSPNVFNIAAAGLSVAAIALPLSLWAVARDAGRRDLEVAIEFLAPVLLMILVQWLILRRRWRARSKYGTTI